MLGLRRRPVLFITDIVDCRFHLASDLKVILCNVFVHINRDVIWAAILENFNLVLVVSWLNHICTVCHEHYDARLDAIVQELFI